MNVVRSMRTIDQRRQILVTQTGHGRVAPDTNHHGILAWGRVQGEQAVRRRQIDRERRAAQPATGATRPTIVQQRSTLGLNGHVSTSRPTASRRCGRGERAIVLSDAAR